MFSIGKAQEKYRRCSHLGTSARSLSRGYGGGGVCPREAAHIGSCLVTGPHPPRAPSSQWGLKTSRDGKAPLYSSPVTATLPWRLWLRLGGGPRAGEVQGLHPSLCWGAPAALSVCNSPEVQPKAAVCLVGELLGLHIQHPPVPS